MELLLVVLVLVLINLLASRWRGYPEWNRRFKEETEDSHHDTSDICSPNYESPYDHNLWR